jgi:hypothetical protein
MAAAFDIGHHAAELLASVWDLHRSPAFLRHIELVYGVGVPELPSLKGVVLVEVDRGDATHGWVQSNPVRWWLADGAGFRAIAAEDQPPEPRELNTAADAGLLYHGWAGMAFFVDGEWVAVRCQLGPELRGRMVGRVAAVGGRGVFTEVRVARSHAESVRPDGPVFPELELWAARRAEPAAAADGGA